MDKGQLTVIKGDVTNPQMTRQNELAIIPHCCNNGRNGDGIGVMGAGVAKALKEKWPLVWESYKGMEEVLPTGLTTRLGENCVAIVEDNIIVVNMIAQDGIASEDNPKPISYPSLVKCMEAIIINLIKSLKQHIDFKHLTPVFHCCKFGSDLAGGDWDAILIFIEREWLNYGYDVVIYEFE